MKIKHFGTRAGLLTAAALLILPGCSDSPTEVHDDPEPVAVEVFVRGTDNRIAYTDDDHWHGSITLAVGEEIEVDVHFLDDQDDIIPLGGEYTVVADIAPGAPTDIIDVASHGDHLDIDGEAVGQTSILLHFWHDDHAEWTAPALTVVVTD